ncbi:MAG: hypothetical protein U1E36_04500 [Rickettsiales bacterium]
MHTHRLTLTEIQKVRRYFLLAALQNLEAFDTEPVTISTLRSEILRLMQPHFTGHKTSAFMSSEHSTRNLLDSYCQEGVVEKVDISSSGRKYIGYKSTSKLHAALVELEGIIPDSFLEPMDSNLVAGRAALSLDSFQALVDNTSPPRGKNR